MNLYDKQGYLDFESVEKLSQTFNFITGGRGTGKTFSALKYAYENKLKFIYIRAMKSQIDFIGSETFNPFKPLNDMFGWNVGVEKVMKDIAGFYNKNEDGTKELIGIICALSSFSSLRGFSAEDYKLIIFDEFIPKESETVRGDWGSQFMDFYETVNRNRELQGREAVKVYCLANSNKIGNQLFIRFNLLNKVIDMILNNKNYSIMKDRGISIFLLSDSPISKKKAGTSLYKAIGQSDYSQMALANMFKAVDKKNVKSLQLRQLQPLVQCGEIYVYLSERGFYISNKGFMKMPLCNMELFKVNYNDVIDSVLFERCTYENIVSKIIAQEYFM